MGGINAEYMGIIWGHKQNLTSIGPEIGILKKSVKICKKICKKSVNLGFFGFIFFPKTSRKINVLIIWPQKKITAQSVGNTYFTKKICKNLYKNLWKWPDKSEFFYLCFFFKKPQEIIHLMLIWVQK